MFDLNVDRIVKTDLSKSSMNTIKEEQGKINPNAFYMAIVEDTDDPYGLGRVRVRIPAIHGIQENQAYYLPNESLPWAKPAILNSAGNDMGQFIVPTKGNRVFVTFEYDELSKPIYFGGIPFLHKEDKYYNDNVNIYSGEEIPIKDNDRIKDLDNNSAQAVIYKSFKGNTIIVDDSDGNESIKIIDASGQQIILRNSSKEPVPRRGNYVQEGEGEVALSEIEVITNGSLKLICNDFNLQANNTNIDSYNKLEIVTGEERATNEYVDGNRVYIKRIDCGALPNTTSKRIDVGLNLNNIIIQDIRGIARHSNNTTIPIQFNSSQNINYDVSVNLNSSSELVITSGSDRSDFTGFVDLKYTKIS